MINEDIRNEIKKSNFKLWQIAEMLRHTRY